MIKHKAGKMLKDPYVFSVISKFCIVFLGFAYTVCQSRYLGPALKGDVTYVSSITSITSIVFGCGVHQAYPYFKKNMGNVVTPLFVKLSLAMLGIYTVFAVILILALHADFQLGAIFLLTPCLVYNKIVAYINMVESPNKKNMTELLANLSEVVFVAAFWFFIPASLVSGILILVLKDVLLAAVYTYRLRDHLGGGNHFSAAQVGMILRFGIYPMLVLLMTTLNYRVDIIMLKGIVTSAEVGVYSVGVMLAERVWMIPDAMKEVMISNLTKGKGADEVCFVIRICNTACIVVVLGIVILGQPFINICFGMEYSGAYPITVVILIGVIFMIYYKMIGAYNIVHGKQKENFYYLVTSVIGNIIANLILIPAFGNIGAALASIFSYAISAFLFTRRFIIENNVEIRNLLFFNHDDVFRLKKKFKRA